MGSRAALADTRAVLMSGTVRPVRSRTPGREPGAPGKRANGKREASHRTVELIGHDAGCKRAVQPSSARPRCRTEVHGGTDESSRIDIARPAAKIAHAAPRPRGANRRRRGVRHGRADRGAAPSCLRTRPLDGAGVLMNGQRTRSPFKHCGVRIAPRRDCQCIRCVDRRHTIRLRARDKYDPAKNRRACLRYQRKNRLAMLMYWHLLTLSAPLR
jgi:hypothetical protein